MTANGLTNRTLISVRLARISLSGALSCRVEGTACAGTTGQSLGGSWHQNLRAKGQLSAPGAAIRACVIPPPVRCILPELLAQPSLVGTSTRLPRPRDVSHPPPSVTKTLARLAVLVRLSGGCSWRTTAVSAQSRVASTGLIQVANDRRCTIQSLRRASLAESRPKLALPSGLARLRGTATRSGWSVSNAARLRRTVDEPVDASDGYRTLLRGPRHCTASNACRGCDGI
jgi:hypothetical protein